MCFFPYIDWTQILRYHFMTLPYISQSNIIFFHQPSRLAKSVSSAKYLRITLSEDISWSTHINNISKKKTKHRLHKKIRVHNKDLNPTVYKTLVSPQLEYGSIMRSPLTATDIDKLESVQRRDARWVTCDFRYSSSKKI